MRHRARVWPRGAPFPFRGWDSLFSNDSTHSHVTANISGMASYMRLHVTELASVNETRIPIRRSSSQSTRQRTFRAWRRTYRPPCACGCCLGVAAHRTKNVTTNILGMASHMRLHVIHEEVDPIFPHVSGENPAGEFVLKTQY